MQTCVPSKAKVFVDYLVRAALPLWSDMMMRYSHSLWDFRHSDVHVNTEIKTLTLISYMLFSSQNPLLSPVQSQEIKSESWLEGFECTYIFPSECDLRSDHFFEAMAMADKSVLFFMCHWIISRNLEKVQLFTSHANSFRLPKHLFLSNSRLFNVTQFLVPHSSHSLM